MLGTALGTLSYFVSSGQSFGTDAAPAGLLGWSWFLVVRLLFMFITKDWLARVGWAAGIVVAVATVFTPLGSSGLTLWLARLSLVVLCSGLVLVATARRVAGRAWAVAAAAIVFSMGVRIVNLDRLSRELGATSVMSGW